jgi:hypothetical protein
MMKLGIINGSPRGKGSNTKILMEHFLKGYTSVCEADFQLAYLSQYKKTDEHLQLFRESEYLIIAFPLYTDAMPGIVMRYIEELESFIDQDQKPALGFVVQSGFPEAYQSRFVERYLIKLTKRLGCEYLGTVIKGGVEGIQIMPEKWTRKLFTSFFNLGKHFGKTKELHPGIIKELAGKEKMTRFRLLFFRIMSAIGLANFYWNKQLKENKAFDKRFDQPYAS